MNIFLFVQFINNNIYANTEMSSSKKHRNYYDSQVVSAYLISCKNTVNGIKILMESVERYDPVQKENVTKFGIIGGSSDAFDGKKMHPWLGLQNTCANKKIHFPDDLSFPAAPGSTNILRLDFNEETGKKIRFYVGFTNCEISTKNFKPNNEIAAINWTSVRDIIDAINGESLFNIEVRNSAKASTKAIFESLGWAAL